MPIIPVKHNANAPAFMPASRRFIPAVLRLPTLSAASGKVGKKHYLKSFLPLSA